MGNKEKYIKFVVSDMVSKTKWEKVSEYDRLTIFYFPFFSEPYPLYYNNGSILRLSMVTSVNHDISHQMDKFLNERYGVSEDEMGEVMLSYWDNLMMKVFGKMDSRRLVKRPRISESSNMGDTFIKKIESLLNKRLEGKFDWLNYVRVGVENYKHTGDYILYTVVFNDVVENFDFTWKRKDGRSQQDVMEIISNFHSKIFSGQKIMFSTDSDLPNNIITKYNSFPYIPLNPMGYYV